MKKLNHLVLIATLILGLSTSYANESNYGLSTTTVVPSLVEKVDKNLGKLRVTIKTSCKSSAAEAESTVRAMKAQIMKSATKEMNTLGLYEVQLDKDSDTVRSSSSSQYSLQYADQNATLKSYVNKCSDEVISLGNLAVQSIEELKNAKSFGSFMTLTYVAKAEIAKLIELKQHLSDKVNTLNKKTKGEKDAVIGNVSFPTFELDEAAQESLKSKLNNGLDLEAQETQVSVDEAFFKKFTGKGFSEKYVKINENANPTYTRTQPALLADGTIKLTKNFSFIVSYLPGNLGTDKAAQPNVQKKGFSVEAEMNLQESDVESYVAVIQVGTQCQATRAEANKVFKKAFNKAKSTVEAELAKAASPGLNAVRINDVESPVESYNDQGVGRKRIVEEVQRINVDGKVELVPETRWETSKWLDSCSGKVTSKDQRKKYWSVSQNFRVLTSSYKTYEVVKKMAKESVGTVEDGASTLMSNRYPSVFSRNSSLVLKSAPWRKAVDAELYEKALYKLTDSKGEVAQYLSSDYVKATSAYYSLGRLGRSYDDGLEFAPAPAPVRAAAPRSANKSYNGEKIAVDGSNLDPHIERAAKSYTVTWKPKVDLMGLIEARKNAESEEAALNKAGEILDLK